MKVAMKSDHNSQSHYYFDAMAANVARMDGRYDVFYSALELSNCASLAQIKSAFHRLMRQYHPDKNYGNLSAEEKCREVNDAYETLINWTEQSQCEVIVSGITKQNDTAHSVIWGLIA